MADLALFSISSDITRCIAIEFYVATLDRSHTPVATFNFRDKKDTFQRVLELFQSKLRSRVQSTVHVQSPGLALTRSVMSDKMGAFVNGESLLRVLCCLLAHFDQ